MLVMRTTEDPADPLGELVGAQQSVGLDDLALSMNPLGLYGIEPRALLRKQADDNPHSTSALFDLPVVSSEPAPDLPGDVPASVVPDEQQNLLPSRFELLQAPPKKTLGR